MAFAPEDASQLAWAARALKEDPALYARLQEVGRRLAEAHDRRTLALRMLDHLNAVAHRAQRS